MPHSTYQYPFEGKVLAWARSMSQILSGQEDYAFFIDFSESGTVRQITFGERPSEFDRQRLAKLKEETNFWFFYDPFDPPEYTYLEWQNIDRKPFERMIGTEFETKDFSATNRSIDFPTSWSVMF